MLNALSRIAVAVLTAAVAAAGTTAVAAQWRDGHPGPALLALAGCLLLATVVVALGLDLFLDALDARNLRIALATERRALDRLSDLR